MQELLLRRPLNLLVVLFPVLVRASSASPNLALAALLPLGVVILLAFVVHPTLRPGQSGRLPTLAWAYVGVVLAATTAWAWRDPTPSTLLEAARISATLFFPAATLRLTPSRKGRERLLACAIVSVFAYILLNLLMWAGGLGSTSPEAAVMLGAFGIGVDRAIFPLAAGVNNIGGVGGAAMVAGLGLMVFANGRGKGFLIAAFGCFAGLAIVLLTDNRGALAFAVLAFLAVTAFRALWATRFAVVVTILPLLALPFLAAGVLHAVAPEDAGARSGESYQTLNGRLGIWQASYQALADAGPQVWVGFGLRGQIASGAGLAIGQFFPPEDPNRFTHTAHSSVLQLLLDAGVLGAAVISLFTVRTLLRLLNGNAPVLLVAGSVLLFFVVAGTLEAHGLPEISDSYPFFTSVLLLGAGVALPETAKSGVARVQPGMPSAR